MTVDGCSTARQLTPEERPRQPLEGAWRRGQSIASVWNRNAILPSSSL
jgi:hypothetical protein